MSSKRSKQDILDDIFSRCKDGTTTVHGKVDGFHPRELLGDAEKPAGAGFADVMECIGAAEVASVRGARGEERDGGGEEAGGDHGMEWCEHDGVKETGRGRNCVGAMNITTTHSRRARRCPQDGSKNPPAPGSLPEILSVADYARASGGGVGGGKARVGAARQTGG